MARSRAKKNAMTPIAKSRPRLAISTVVLIKSFMIWTATTILMKDPTKAKAVADKSHEDES
jgi:hypothetical protein